MTHAGRRRHLRDVATICPVVLKMSTGAVVARCELDAGHDGKHEDGCTSWGRLTTAHATA